MYIVHLKNQQGAILTSVMQVNKDYVRVEKAHWYTDYEAYNRRLIKEIELADIPIHSVFMIETELDRQAETN